MWTMWAKCKIKLLRRFKIPNEDRGRKHQNKFPMSPAKSKKEPLLLQHCQKWLNSIRDYLVILFKCIMSLMYEDMYTYVHIYTREYVKTVTVLHS